MSKKEITRKCIVTNKRRLTSEMIRIVKTKDGQFHIDSQAKGRGAYVSKDPTLIKIFQKHKCLNRSFKMNVPTKVYDDVIKVMEADDEK